MGIPKQGNHRAPERRFMAAKELCERVGRPRSHPADKDFVCRGRFLGRQHIYARREAVLQGIS